MRDEWYHIRRILHTEEPFQLIDIYYRDQVLHLLLWFVQVTI
jgi:hypothetical protein